MNDSRGFTRSNPRRVITYVDHDGRSKFWDDMSEPAAVEFESVPGLRSSVLWATSSAELAKGVVPDPIPTLESLHPQPGGTTVMIITIPPDSVYEDPAFDPAKAAAEQGRHMKGIIDRMEPDAPGFHATDTIDYSIVLEGAIRLEVDEGAVDLSAGDIVVQLGARHAWRNPGSDPAKLIFVLIGARWTASN